MKVHKDEFPLRPITAMRGCVGYHLGKIFNEMLKEVFPFTKYHIKDSYQFVKYTYKKSIKRNDRLVSFDVVSMFTIIPIDLAKEIILSRSNLFLSNFSLNQADLTAVMNFLLIDCTYFTFENEIFKQVGGFRWGAASRPHWQE